MAAVYPSVNIPPYRDTNLENRPGEVWKDIPGLKGLYYISNCGRVLRAERKSKDRLGRPFTKARQIILPRINKDRNLHLKEWSQRLQVSLTVSGRAHNLQVARLVYYLFVEHFDLKNPYLVISYKNNNGLDVFPENLELMDYHSKNHKSYDSGRQLSHFTTDPIKHRQVIVDRINKSRRTISCYTMQGKLVTSFHSLINAAKLTGLSYSGIRTALKDPFRKTGKLYWRLGDAAIINMKEIKETIRAKNNHRRVLVAKPLIQMDIEGNILACYSAKSIAANITGIAHKSISKGLVNPNGYAGGFLWKEGNPLNCDFTKQSYYLSTVNGRKVTVNDCKKKKQVG